MADKDKNPNLGCLEEDDEFEEFPVEGKFYFIPQNVWLLSLSLSVKRLVIMTK